MKQFSQGLIIFSTFLFGCENRESGLNQFTSSSDTLIIRTNKHIDSGPFYSLSFPITFKDIAEEVIMDIKIPNEIEETKVFQLSTDFAEEQPNYVSIISGLMNNEKIYVVDANNNTSFNDDSIRTIKKMKWDSSEELIKCKYHISNGQQIVEDSSWIQIREENNNISLAIKEHLRATLYIDNEKFELGITDLFSGNFTYGNSSWIAILSTEDITIDSLFERDLLTIGEYIKLEQHYYRFEGITNNGEFITLIKEKDFYNKVGTQVGMIAPDFNAITISGDTISSSILDNKLTVIANSCGCGGDKKSTQAYYEMERLFGNTIKILHVDSKIEKSSIGIHIDSEKEFNKEFYNNYRQEFCSRICYVIGKDKRIIDKFNINEWKSYLPKIIEEKN